VAAATSAIAFLLPAHALGAGITALVLQRVGAVYRAASDVGAILGGEADAGLRHADARNPATVAALVGNHVGIAATRTVDFHVAVCTANAVAGLLGLTAYASSGSPALALLPFVVLAFGVLASGFGVMVVRHLEHEPPTRALWRGHAATSVVTLGGLAGACIWLLEDHWLSFFAAGSLGVLALAASVHLGRLRLTRRLGFVRELQDAGRAGVAPTISSGLGVGLQTALLPLLAMGLVLSLSWQLGASSRVPMGGFVATWTAIMALLATGPYLLTTATFNALASSSLGIAAMGPAGATNRITQRAQVLDEAGFTADLVAQPYLIVTGSLIALSAALVVPAASGSAGTSPLRVNLANPLVLWGGIVGTVVVLGYAGQVIRLVTKGVRDVASEVERQLRRFPREHGGPAIPEDFAPSYRACIDLANRYALSGLLLPVATLIAVPAGITVAVAVLRVSDTATGIEALTSFVAISAITGLSAAMVVDTAGTLLSAGRRIARQRGVGSSATETAATTTGEAIASILRSGAGAPALLTIKVIAVVTLVVAPFVT
jgi:K(+)-stimulated pyrophosphate-energized sodium pump